MHFCKTMTKKVKHVLTFEEMIKELKKMPPKKYLWSGIKEVSIGLVFGPSKSGKSIWCENLGLKIAIGDNMYMGYSLDGIPKRVLYIGLEEYWENRVERNAKQHSILSESEKKLYETNYLYQPIDYLNLIITESDWARLRQTIEKSKAEVVIIDSITRMNHGNMEDSRVAQEIMQKLRNICYELKITLICIHHTPKMYNQPITMDSIKGSSVFAQEADFAIGINAVHSFKIRYMKNIFFRYSGTGSELVRVFSINDNTQIVEHALRDENDIIFGEDRRKENDKREEIIKYLNASPCKEYKTSDLIKTFSAKLSIKERQIKNYLKDLVNQNKIKSPKKGYYSSIECNEEKEVSDEN